MIGTYGEMIAKGLEYGPYSLFFHAWPWMGAGAAVVMLILAFGTNLLRADLSKPRMKDPAFLAWLGFIVYLLHNFEEYGVDVYGNSIAFTHMMTAWKGVRIPEAPYLVCNLGLVWLVAPLTAFLVQRGYRNMAAGMACFEILNGTMHIVQSLNWGFCIPGTINAVTMCYPIGFWTLYVCYGLARQPKSRLAALFLSVVLYHVILVFGLGGIVRTGVSSFIQSAIMVADNALLLAIWCWVGKMKAGVPAKESGDENKFISWWCFKPWQIALDAIGAAFAVALCLNWHQWGDAQRLFLMIGILIPIHVFEEWWWPAGFHWQYNLVNGSDRPERYPMCRLSDMVTNTIACIMFSLMGVLNLTASPCIVAMTGFCLLEVIIHTFFGCRMLQRYRKAGKRTIYGPGSFTAYACFLPLFVWGVLQLHALRPAALDYAYGVGLLIALLLVIVILPEKGLGSKNSPYAFLSAGYFEKFLKRSL